MGLKPDFNGNDTDRAFDTWEMSVNDKIFEILKYVGEDFVNNARNLRTYQNVTGNLRSSIGFVIAYDGKIKLEDLEGEPEGMKEAKQTVTTVLQENSLPGYVLIGVAGMDYAAAVESRNYDVITGSSIEAQKLLKDLVKKAFQ